MCCGYGFRVRSCGPPRNDELHLQQPLGVAAQDFCFVLVGERHGVHPVQRRRVHDERPIDREQDMIDAHLHHAAQQRRIGEIAARRDVIVAAEDVAEAQRFLARPLERLVDAPDQKRQRFAEMTEDDFQLRMPLEHAGQHEADGGGRGFHRIAPGRPRHGREILDVVVVVDARHLGLRQSGMQIDRHVELFGARINRPEFLVVEEGAVGEAVQHGALEAEFFHAALELVGSRLGHRGRQAGEGGEALRILGDLGVQAIVDAPRERGRGFGRQFLRRRRAERDHLHVDADVVHLLDAQRAEIVQPLLLLARPAGFAADVSLRQFLVPVMLFDGDDRTMRFTKHLCFPFLRHCERKRSNPVRRRSLDCFAPLAMTPSRRFWSC